METRSAVYGQWSPLADVVTRAVVEPSRDIEGLRRRMAESTRQVEGLFDGLLAEAFTWVAPVNIF